MPGPEDSPIPDPLIWLAFLAARTTTLRLCTGVLILPQRNPLVLAKEVATLDQLSKGRVTLGVGVGWLAEEFAALGVPFAERAARTDETIAAMRAAWTQNPASHHGTFHNFTDVHVLPQPVQAGGVPDRDRWPHARGGAAGWSVWATASFPRRAASTNCRACSTRCARRPTRRAATPTRSK